MFRLEDSEGGYIGTFPSWQDADNYRFVYGNSDWEITQISYCMSYWSFKNKPFK